MPLTPCCSTAPHRIGALDVAVGCAEEVHVEFSQLAQHTVEALFDSEKAKSESEENRAVRTQIAKMVSVTLRFRYRRLVARDDPQAMAALKSQRQQEALGNLDFEEALFATGAGAPKAVEATDAEASADELAEALRNGSLSPNDLVFSGGAWTTFEQSPEFFEVCEPLVRRRAGRWKALTWLVVVVVVVLLLGALLVKMGEAAVRARLPW